MFQHIYNLRFIDIFTGWPRRSADGSILKHSPLSQNLPQLMDNNSEYLTDTYHIYKARHAHKHLYTVLPKYSKIQVLPGITSCRLMKYNKQAIELKSLLINNMPKDGYEWSLQLWQVIRIWKEFGIKTHNFTNPLLVQHKTHLQAKSTLNHTENKQAGHTNENKQFWPKYKVITITKIWKYSIFTKIRVFNLIYGYKRKQLKEYMYLLMCTCTP